MIKPSWRESPPGRVPAAVRAVTLGRLGRSAIGVIKTRELSSSLWLLHCLLILAILLSSGCET